MNIVRADRGLTLPRALLEEWYVHSGAPVAKLFSVLSCLTCDIILAVELELRQILLKLNFHAWTDL